MGTLEATMSASRLIRFWSNRALTSSVARIGAMLFISFLYLSPSSIKGNFSETTGRRMYKDPTIIKASTNDHIIGTLADLGLKCDRMQGFDLQQ
ncbi:hypothetical protein TNCV_2935141 [Trichonephila clavipes]|nr:hypothetical protein TNCV_2935141 [Trichonephila clavipes]